jgi:hypothetical protein
VPVDDGLNDRPGVNMCQLDQGESLQVQQIEEEQMNNDVIVTTDRGIDRMVSRQHRTKAATYNSELVCEGKYAWRESVAHTSIIGN